MKENVSGCFFSEHSVVVAACILKENSFTFKTDNTKEILKTRYY